MPIDITPTWEQVCLGEDSDLELNEVQFRDLQVSAPSRDNLADELGTYTNLHSGRLFSGSSDNRQPQSLNSIQLNAMVNLITGICSDSIEPIVESNSNSGMCNSMTTNNQITSQFTRNEILAFWLGRCTNGDVCGSGELQSFIERLYDGISVIDDERISPPREKLVFKMRFNQTVAWKGDET